MKPESRLLRLAGAVAAWLLLSVSNLFGQSLSLSPSRQNLYATQTQQFTALLGGQATSAVTWSISPSTGTLSTSGLYTAPLVVPTQTTVTVTAVLNSNNSISATATVSLAPITMSISPSSQNLNACQTQQYTAQVNNNPNTAVTWTINPIVGSINSSGVYTAPGSIATQQTITVTATSVADPTKSISSSATLHSSTGSCAAVSVTMSPTAANVYGGQTQQFTATVSNTSNTAVTWTLNSGAPGSISSSGLYTAPATVTAVTTVTVTATSQADTTKSATATITLYPPVTITVAPATATLYGGQTQQFTANSTNPTTTAATWTLNSGAPGSISSSGLYTAPATVTAVTTVTVTATSQVNNTKSATATITLYPPVAITVAPTTASLYAGQTQQFTASATNPTTNTATWTLNAGAPGTISSSGLYTAPATVTAVITVTVTATSQVNTSVSATATITLYPPVTIAVTPAAVALYGGQTQQFTASATNPTTTTATWTLNSGAPGSISNSGLYTAPATVTTQTTVTVTATSQVNAAVSTTATITLYPPVTITVVPPTVVLYGGQTQQFTANSTNPTSTAATWTLNSGAPGSISSSGLYTAPATITATTTVSVTATSQADATKSATATITLSPSVSVTLAPTTATLTVGQTKQLSATVQGSSNVNVTWTVSPVGAGTVSSTGLYSAPPCVTGQETVTVTATSQADTTKSASAIITLQYANGYSYRRAIVINHNNVPNTDQTNFPVLVNNTDSTLASVLNGGHVQSPSGSDLTFTSDSGCSTTLNYEIQAWNAITGQLTAWVQVPLVSHTSDTPIYLCYGNGAITTSQANAAAVWDTNYLAVYHLGNGTTLSVNDSTGNHNGTNTGTVAPSTGAEFNGAALFNGTNSVNTNFEFGSTDLTLQAWVNPNFAYNDNNRYAGIVGDLNDAGNAGALLYYSAGSGQYWHFYAAYSGGGANAQGPSLASDAQLGRNTWQFLVGRVASQVPSLWMNGASIAVSPSTGSGSFNPMGNNAHIGVSQSFTGVNANWTGLLQEVRISKISRANDWITTEYNNQSSPATFYTFFGENAAFNITPAVSYLYAGQTQQLTALGSSCTSSSVTWSIPSSAPGTINSAGVYTAPATIASQQAVTITATSQSDGITTGTATVNLFPPIGVSVTPTTILMTNGLTQQFSAALTNATNNAVTWSLSPAAAGTLSSTGLYTAPTTVTTTQPVTVTATSVTDPAKSGSATITLIAQVSAPTFSIPAGLYGTSQLVTITSASPYASIRYTTDGSTPSETVGTVYSGPITVSSNVTLNAIAYQYGLADSTISTAAYTFSATTASVRFVTANTSTEGNWIGLYGKDGYYIPSLADHSFPSYVTVGYPGLNYESVWNSSTYDVRALQKPAPAIDRFASFAFPNSNAFTFDLNFTDGATHQFAVYFLDWTNSGDGDIVTIRDSATQAILDTRTIQNFSNGAYLVWTVTGHVSIEFQGTNNDGLFSGWFFDPPTVTVTPVTTTLSPGQTQQFSAIVSTSTNQSVNWTITPSVGTISASGLYTAPTSVAAQQPVSITATSQANPAKSGSATVTLLPGTNDGLTQAISIIVKSLCRDPHAAPVVSAGADQLAYITGYYYGVNPPPNSAIATLTGTVLSYTLNPGDLLTYAWSVVSGPGTVQFSAPTAQSTVATFTAAGYYTLQFSVNDGIATTTSQVHVTVAPAPVGNGNSFVITPAATGPIAQGSTINIGLHVYGYFAGNGSIQLQITGANPQSVTLPTDGNGAATFAYIANNTGTDTISGTAVGSCCTGPITSNVSTVTIITEPSKLTSSPVTAQFFPADGTGIFNTLATQTPAFTQVFPAIDFDPAPGTVTGNTSTVANQTRPFTDIVTDRYGNFVGSIVAQGTDYQAGAGPMYAFSGVFTGVLNVPSAGSVTFSITSDDGFIFGIGNGATRVSGPQINTPAATPFNNYAVMGGVNQREDTAASTIVVNFPAAGAYPYELDYAKGGDKNLTLVMKANGSLIPASVLLTLTPSTVPTSAPGQIQQFVLTATDADGQALANLPVTFTISGENVQTRQLTTNAAGQTQFAYQGGANLFGTDTLQAAAYSTGATAYSNVVTIQWNNGVNQAPVVSAGTAQSITLPSQAVLYGSVTDDGLPNNTLTVTWSMQSGPAPVVFDDAAQAATTATFSAPGTYVLLLTGSDGALTSTSTVTITVNQATTWNTGWLANPLNGATVTGQVPVTLISGITLTSGTLTFYPANNQSAITTISASTTGTGQIGVFDTTLLNNGSYFVELYATNSLGVTQTNLALVTVVGNYKPGRVTATVTDFTVPSAGLSIQIQRTYDSLIKSQLSDFGYGWQLGLNAVNLTIDTVGDVTLTIGGQRRTFYFQPSSTIIPNYYVPQYTAEPGFYGSMSNTGDNCSGVLLAIGNLYQCGISNAGSIYQASGFKYTDPYGRVYTIGATGALQSLKDLNGNTLTLASTGITSSTGLNIPFVRDTQGRITQITDAVGNVYKYVYDANGNLSTVTFPSIATPTTYGYDPTHLLTSEQDPRGNTGSTSYYPNGQVQSITDAAGQTTSYVYNVPANTTTVTNPDGGTVTTVTDAYGMPLTVTDPLGRVTTNTYDPKHNLLTSADPLGKTTTYTYDSNGFRTSLKDPLGNIWASTYNPVGGPLTVTNPLNQTQNIAYDSFYRISTITDSLGSVAGFTYNTQGLPLTLLDARGNTSNYAYDQYGNRTGYTDPLNRTTTSVYNTMGWMSSQTDPRSNQTQYAYDSLGRKTSMTDANGKVTQYAYDANNNKISETDALNRITTYSYDSVNRMTGVTYPDGTTKSYTYDFRNNKLTETDQLGRVTKNVYDLAGQLSSTTVAFGTPDAATTSYTYDLDGRKLTQTDPRGNTTYYAYDAGGRMTSMTDAIGNITQYGYDGKGQRTSMIDAKSRTTTYTYDARGRQLTANTPDGKTVTKAYDPLGLVLTTTDEENRTTTFGYDAASQLTSVMDALNQITHYTYDLDGNKLTQVDANSHSTSYAWDNLNRRTSRTLPLGQSESFTYDAVGNMATRIDFNGKTTTYAYDPLNRLRSRTPDPSFSAAPIAFTYTSTGQRLTMTDPSGTTTYTYTNRDQVASKATPQGTLTYTYDPAGNVASTVSSNTNGTNVTYAWDADNRLSSVTDSRLAGATTTYSYDATNQLSLMTYPNGVTHSYAYDTRDRILTLNGYTQTFSDSGRKLSITEATGRAANYGYDAIYRLLNEGISGDPTPANNGVLAYMLDPVGNRKSLISTLAASQTQTFTYDADDHISGDTFDANGNTITSGGVTYSYDFEDRLLSTSNGVTIIYDGDGNRVSENGTTYLIDDQTPTGYAQVAEELVSGTVSAQFTYGPMRISQRRTATRFYGYDAGGSVRVLFDNTGTVTDAYAYDAFGNTVGQTGSIVNEFQYRGEQYDASLQMYYLRARYYVPRTGRFLMADKFEGLAKRPASFNRYGYAEVDPADLVDPSGYNAGDMVLRGWRINVDWEALVRQAVIATAASCVLVRVWSRLDDVIEGSGGAPTLPPNLLPECQGPCKVAFPTLINVKNLWAYPFKSWTEAWSILVLEYKPYTIKAGQTAPATSGPCRVGGYYQPGDHTNVLFASGPQSGLSVGQSVVMCPCCDESSGTAVPTKRYGLQ
jgi:RHS repeat-associated protein